ncbi:MAG TPA: XdhC/CoxI family protein, partial [Ktedonobacterales bacterium]|nr:XdhC/CoxI family protein [Ktedonobacterales bacterium]
DISGSVSGGCVEPDVIEEAQTILRATRPGALSPGPRAKLLTYGVSEEENFERIGLSCGGEIQVFVQAFDPADWREVAQAIHAGQSAGLGTIIGGPAEWVGLNAAYLPSSQATYAPLNSWHAPDAPGAEIFNEYTSASAARLLHEGASEVMNITPMREGAEWSKMFFASYLPQPTLIVIGAGHITIPLTRIAKTVGYRTVVMDAREAFATRERLPDADEIIIAWPDEALGTLPLNSATAIAVLTHDDKFDVPALTVALTAPDVAYVGAIGSRGTRAKRDERLRAAGITDEQIARIHGPIGLDIGAGSPEEIALAIMAQIVAARHGKA